MGRLPERDTRAAAQRERRFGWRPSNATIAVIFLIIFTVGPYLAFTKHIPFTSYGYQLKATFTNSANIAKNSPVRIAANSARVGASSSPGTGPPTKER